MGGGGGPPAPHFRDKECRVQSRATVRGVQYSQTPPIPGALRVFPHSHQGDSGPEKAQVPEEWQQGPGRANLAELVTQVTAPAQRRGAGTGEAAHCPGHPRARRVAVLPRSSPTSCTRGLRDVRL